MVLQTLRLTLLVPWATLWIKLAAEFAALFSPLLKCPLWRAAAPQVLQTTPMVSLLNSTNLPLLCGTPVDCCMLQMEMEAPLITLTQIIASAASSSLPLRFLHWQVVARQEVWMELVPLPPSINLVESPSTPPSPHSTLQTRAVTAFAPFLCQRRKYRQSQAVE